MIVQNPES